MDFGQAEFRQHLHPPSFTINNSNNYPRRQDSLRTHLVTMNGSDNSKGEEMVLDDMWNMPTSQPKPRPATIHEGFSFCVPGNYQSLVSWDSSSLSYQQAPSDVLSRPISMHQDDCPTDHSELVEMQDYHKANVPPASWSQKSYDESLDLQGLDSDSAFGNTYASDELIPILDLYQDTAPDGDSVPLHSAMDPRRMSGSSFTVSTSGGLSDMPSYEDFSAALSEAQSFTSDFPLASNRNSLMSSTQLSPVTSPRLAPQTRTELVRTQSRGRGQASPSPRPGVRSAPYSVEGVKNKRWSTGSYGTMANRKPSPFVYHPNPDVFNAQRMSTRHSSPTTATVPLPLNYGNLQAVQQAPFMMAAPPLFQRNTMFLPSHIPTVPSQALTPEVNNFGAPAPLLSHGLFRMLQSNADPHCLHSAYTDLSDPPDLYASLQEEQSPPPPEDMNPDDPDLVPHEQELRFDGDLYTPRWVRGHGNKREGWCGICKPGRWLVLKNSAFWYDKSFSHGISAATGSPFQEPQQKRRMDGSPEVWEGLCGSCNDWIPLVSSKKKGTTWFRHAYKCHTHPKVKDVPKRRRESSNARALAASTMAKTKIEPQPPVTPQMTPVSISLSDTPTPAKMPLSTLFQSQQEATPVPSSQSLNLSPRKLLVQGNTFSNMI